MKNVLTTSFIFLLFSFTSKAVTCTSLGNGPWESPATWSCGAAPVTGDTIIILIGDTVVLSMNTDLTGLPVVLIIDGTLLFDTPSAKLFLECGSTLYISPTGSLVSTGNGTSSHSIKICNVKVWDGSIVPLVGPVIFGTPLPIELVFFKAVANGHFVDFTWQTASESNNDYFTIEGSFDASNWQAMTTQKGAGNTTTVTNYAETLSNRMEGFEYFRLKQTDFDGKSSYSPIVTIELGAIEAMKLYPNPSNGNDLNLTVPFEGAFEIQIMTANGQLLHQQRASSNSVILRDLRLEGGMYIVQAISASGSLTERLIVR